MKSYAIECTDFTDISDGDHKVLSKESNITDDPVILFSCKDDLETESEGPLVFDNKESAQTTLEDLKTNGVPWTLRVVEFEPASKD